MQKHQGEESKSPSAENTAEVVPMSARLLLWTLVTPGLESLSACQKARAMRGKKPPLNELNVGVVVCRKGSAGEDVGRPGATSCNEGEMGILLSGMG